MDPDDLLVAVQARTPVDERERISIERFATELVRLERPYDEDADPVHVTASAIITGPRGDDWLIYHGRATPGGARTLRIDPLVWNDAADPPTVTVRGPTTSPQPRP